MYYEKKFEKVSSVILSLNQEEATSLRKAKKVWRTKDLWADSQHLQTNFEYLVECIIKLQNQGLSLQESLSYVQHVKDELSKQSRPASKLAKRN